MSITDIRNKIIFEAEEEKKHLEGNFEKKKQDIQNNLAEEKKRLESVFGKELEKTLGENKRKSLSLLGREEKIKRENLKREIVEDVLKNSLLELGQISDQDFLKFAKKVFHSIPKDLKGNVLTDSRNTSLLKSLIQDYLSLSLQEDHSVKGGFLILGDNFRYDFTFKSLLQSKRDDLELELSKILFS